MLNLLDEQSASFDSVFGPGRGRPHAYTGKRVFATREEFYDADQRRRMSGEADYGVNWCGPNGERSPGWAVHYVGSTGEVYAHCSAGPGKDTVIVLGHVEPDCDWFDSPTVKDGRQVLYYSTLDRVLGEDTDDSWSAHHNQPDGLEWIRQRLDAHAESLRRS